MEANTQKMTSLKFEHAYPWLISGGVFIVATGAHCAGLKLPSSESFFSAIVSLGGVFAGFMATLKAMMYGLEAATFKRLKDSGYLHDLTAYLSAALWSSLLLCVTAILGFFSIATYVVLDAGVLAVVAFAIASIYRVSSIATNLFLARQA